MGVYLGNVGQIELQRNGSDAFVSGGQNVELSADVEASGVAVSVGRFELKGKTVPLPSSATPASLNPSVNPNPPPSSALITGDQVEFRSTVPLAFIDGSGFPNGTVQSSGSWFVHVDEIGGIKLYDTFANSLNGEATGRIALAPITATISVTFEIISTTRRVLGCITEYEINTNREVVDVTSLSDQHRQQYSSLITGSGSLIAQWDYIGDNDTEKVQYLMSLVLRTEIGSKFTGRFYIKAEDTSAASGSFSPSQINDALWWEFDALITGSAVSFAPGDIVTGRIEFVATGPIRLRAQSIQINTLQGVLQQNGSQILLNSGGGAVQGNKDVSVTLTTTSFTDGGAIGADYYFDDAGCTGLNTSPQLAWTASGADVADIAAYSLRCVDLSANNFIHWSVDDIPVGTTSIAEDGTWPGTETINATDWEPTYSVNANGWGGPCPPALHTYEIRVTARDSSGVALANATLTFTAT